MNVIQLATVASSIAQALIGPTQLGSLIAVMLLLFFMAVFWRVLDRALVPRARPRSRRNR